jgi:type VI protein secretion system component VasF
MKTSTSLTSIFDGFVTSFQLQLIDLVQTISRAHDSPTKQLGSSLDLIGDDKIDLFINNTIQVIEKLSAGKQRYQFLDNSNPFAYALAAWSDEMLIRYLKSDKEFRHSGAIEYHLFGTRESGEKIFEHINYLLDSETTSELLGVYLKMISLGYRGYLFRRDSDEDLEYLNSLYDDLNSIAPDINNQKLAIGSKNDQPISFSKKRVKGFRYYTGIVALFAFSAMFGMLYLNNKQWDLSDSNINKRIQDLYLKYIPSNYKNDS